MGGEELGEKEYIYIYIYVQLPIINMIFMHIQSIPTIFYLTIKRNLKVRKKANHKLKIIFGMLTIIKL